jgi:hypothetical protein
MAQPQSQAPAPECQLPPRIPLVHNAALAGTILIPMVMLLPPRKMDVRFFILAGSFSLATNQLCYEYTGQSIYGRFYGKMGSVFTPSLPEKALETQRLIREQREREAAARAAREKASGANGAAAESRQDTRSGGDVDVSQAIGDKVKHVWMGDEKEGWQERRMEEHRRALEDGKGLSGIMMDQISEAWDALTGGSSSANKDDNDKPSSESKR